MQKATSKCNIEGREEEQGCIITIAWLLILQSEIRLVIDWR